LLIEVKASSINPLDLWMSQGYGYSIFELMRSKTVENFSSFNPFPITLGRDFSGVVVDKGMNAGEFKVGDQVLIFFRRPLVSGKVHGQVRIIFEVPLNSGKEQPGTAFTTLISL
jgi:NADPH:quinone reductase-like Zn-dependent oxidoreductase